ncbi:hypothetical protein HPB50_017473 [Hyalomma asiaticum]|uniref:Uncharacterized protein n=1 Tax=Hyalomma asiaticum TaxID=266040 RepID=A0ACB7RLC5_HYAAI|nr:hypothetical protein HPB50_017473 [Hyalomma asiaticum]
MYVLKREKKDEEDGGSNPFSNLEKTSVLQEARTFNETPVNPRKCAEILTKILYLLNQGEVLGTREATDAFFAMTKLFQCREPVLRRLVYLGIKELSKVAEDVIIVTSSLTKDMTGKEDLYRASAIRALCKITDHCGFVRETASTAGASAAGDSTSSMEENASSVDEDFERLNRTTTFAEFVEADDDVAICGELSLDDAIAEALPDADTTATSDEDEDDAAAAADAVPTSFADMLRHIDGIRSYVCTREATEDVLLYVAKLEGKLLRLGSKKVQKKLTDFF